MRLAWLTSFFLVWTCHSAMALSLFPYINDGLEVAQSSQAKGPDVNLEKVLDLHRQAVLGNLDSGDIKSLHLTGVWISGGVKNPITVQMLQPFRNRLDIRMGDSDISQVFDGDWGWFMQVKDGVRQVRWMKPGENANMERDSSFFNYMVEEQEGVSLDLISAGEKINVRATLKFGQVISYWLDPETYLLLREVKADFGGEGFRVLEYHDYRSVDGLMMAHRIDSFVHGELQSSLLIDEVKINEPIPPIIFTAPIAGKPNWDSAVDLETGEFK